MNELTIGQHSFDLAMPVAVLLAVTVVLTVARTLYRQWRAEPAQRSRAWRVALLVLAQPLCAGLLYFALFPPTLPGEAGTLLVASAGATGEQFEALAAGDARVALPEAPELPGVERVPDLATALRRHPGTQRIRIAGEQGNNIHKGYSGYIENGVSIPWGRMNHMMGCGAGWSDEARAQYFLRLQNPEGRHYMVGDQISYHTSWQEGAFASVEFALQDLDRRVRAEMAAGATAS